MTRPLVRCEAFKRTRRAGVVERCHVEGVYTRDGHACCWSHYRRALAPQWVERAEESAA